MSPRASVFYTGDGLMDSEELTWAPKKRRTCCKRRSVSVSTTESEKSLENVDGYVFYVFSACIDACSV